MTEIVESMPTQITLRHSCLSLILDVGTDDCTIAMEGFGMTRSFRWIAIAIAATTVFILVTEAVQASIPDADGVIHGCRKTTDGSVRVIDDAATATCPKGYAPLNWEAAPRPGTLFGVHIVQSEQPIVSDGGQHVLHVSCPIGEQALSLSAFVNDIPGETQGIREEAPAHNWAGTLTVPISGYFVYVDARPAGNPDSQLHAEVLCAKVTS